MHVLTACAAVLSLGLVGAGRGTDDASCPSAPRGVLGHWELDDRGGQVVQDSSEAGQPGRNSGALSTEGVRGTALQFDGQDDFVALGDLGEYDGVTIAFWMKADNVGKADDWQGLVSSDAWDDGVLHIPLRAGVVDVHLHRGEASRGRLVSSKLSNGTWYHIAIVADTAQGIMQLFVNGLVQDAEDISKLSTKIKLIQQVVGRESGGRYFRGAVDDVHIVGRALSAAEIKALCPDAAVPTGHDFRNVRTGHGLPDEGYSDQPYTIVTKDGNWLSTLTTGPGHEGQAGQHIVATISSDHGMSWSELIDIEPSGEREASWVMPLLTPSGRVYVFYTYNADNIHTLNDKRIRADTLGWYAYKYSDDNGRTWSQKRYRLPMRLTAVDRENEFQGKVQCFWGIGKPITVGTSAFFAFSKVGKLVVDNSEGWFYHSDNILTEPDPEKLHWELLPDGDRGLEVPEFGDIHSEQNLVPLNDGTLYCMYRTVVGSPFHTYSRDGGHTWTKPEHATYTPGGKRMKNPRACPRIWRTSNGKFLFWYHNQSLKSFQGRNPAWVSGGVEKDGAIHWSQPEILLYDPDPNVRISYPDLVEQDGRYWVTETQKSIARVHEIDPTLFEGLWQQGQSETVTREGLVFECAGPEFPTREAKLTRRLNLAETSGLSLDFWITFKDLQPGQVILDSRSPKGDGLALTTTDAGTIQIELSDGKNTGAWDCDPGVLQSGKRHHVAVVVDAGPRIISFLVDGVVCNGGEARDFGWGRYKEELGDVTGSATLHLAPSLHGELECVKIYSRYLRISEAVANFHAGSSP